MVKKRIDGKRGMMALGQILVLIIGTIAIAYVLGSQTGGVSAAASIDTTSSMYTNCVNGQYNDQVISGAGSAIPNLANNANAASEYFCYGDHVYWVTQGTPDPGNVLEEYRSSGDLFYIKDSSGDWVYSHTGQLLITSPVSTSSQVNDITLFNNLANQVFSNYQSNVQLSNQGSSSSSQSSSQTPTNPSSQQTPPTTNGVPSGAGNQAVSQCKLGCFSQGSSDIPGCVQSCINGLSTAAGDLSTLKGLANKVAGAGAKAGSKGSFWGDLFGKGGAKAAGGSGKFFGGIEKVWTKIAPVVGTITEIAGAAAAAWAIHQGLDWAINQIPGLNKNSNVAAGLELANNLVSGGIVFPVVLGLLSHGGLVLGMGFWPWAGIGAGVALALYFIFYKQHTEKAVQFACIPWQAPLGAGSCGQCGENGLPCTAYECASLGQNCQLLNSGGTGEQICTAVNQNTNPPKMSFISQSLPTGYSVSPLGATVLSSTGDTGVLVTANTADGKVPPYTSLNLQIHTDKPSICAFSPTRIPIKDSSGNDTFNQLNLLDSGLYLYNHTIPIQPNTVSPTGEIELYIRCHDANSPIDYAPNYFIIKFGTEQVPDTSNPIVLGTDIQNASVVPYSVSSANVSIYVSKAVSECRWSHTAESYAQMTSHTLDCSQGQTPVSNGVYYSISDNTMQSAVNSYRCTANLTGIQHGLANTYYFRCNDTLGDVNDANPPASFSLGGSSQTLSITSASPNNTVITGGSDSVKVALNVQTLGGSDGEGTAWCYYNDTVNTNQYTLFGTSPSYQNTEDLWLPSGNYNFPIKCVDSSGNVATADLNFSVYINNNPPSIVRVYKSNSDLYVVTNENATCFYDTHSCTYNPMSTGQQMTDSSDTVHYTPWVTDRSYYIKCENSYGIGPAAPDSCTSIIQASSL